MKKLLTFLTLLTLFFTTAWAETGTIYFGSANGRTNINKPTVTGQDNLNNTWTITTVGTTSFTPNSVYNQVGSSNKPATSITFTTTLPNDVDVTSMQAKFGGFSGTAGTITLKVGDTSIGTGSLNGTNDVTVTSTSTASGKVLTVTVTNISKGVKCYFISYEYTTGGTSSAAAPTFSPAAGTYYEPVNVTLSTTTPDATIHYTTDGNDPDESSAEYNGPITVNETMTIKAIATATGYDPSSVATATYTITAPLTSLAAVNGLNDNEVFTYGAQTVVLGVNGKNMYIVMPDNTAGTLVYANENWSNDYAFGKVINSGWGGTKTTYSTKPEVKNPTNFSLSGTTAEVTPIEITSSDITLPNFGCYAVLKGVTVTSGGAINGITTYNQFGVNFNSSAGAYDVYGVIGWHNGAGQFMPLEYVPASASTPVYYLAGTFNNWQQNDDYIFTESNGTYTLNGVDLPDNAEFQIIKVVNNSASWYGGATNDDVYGIHGGWHENITLTQGAKNFRIEAGAITNFSFTVNNGNPSVLNVNRDPQLFIKTSNDNFSTKTALASASDGWTMNRDFTAYEAFGFVDEWGYWHGKEWTIKSEHFGQDIPMETSSNYVMELAGNYNLAVNAARSTLVVTSTAGDGEYVKVTSSTDLTDGEYLIVYEDGLLAFDGSLETLDAVGNSISVTINDNKIPGNATVNAAVFTYNANAKTLKSASGYYIGQTSDANGLAANAETQYENTITFDGGNANIVSGGAYLRYNSASNQLRFRYYKSSSYTGQKPVALYKKTSSVPPSDQVATPVITPSSQTVYGGLLEGISIACATNGAAIYYTTNGDTPTANSTLYEGSFDLTSQGGNVTVKAIAVKDGMDNSEVATATYLFTSPVAPTFTPTATAQTGDFTVEISSEYEDGVIYYMLDPEGVPTANNLKDDGTVYQEGFTVSGEGTHKVYAIVELNGIKSSVASITYTITSGGTTGDGDYVKVTTAADLTDGEYLIVYEMEGTPIENGIVFDGSRTSLDAVGNTLADPVEINNYTIASSDAVDAAVFTYDSAAGTLKSASGYYIGKETYANGLDYDQSTAYTNTITFDEYGNAVITAKGGCTMRYNKNSDQLRFRYYKTGQQPIALYKKVENPVDEPTQVTLAELCATGEEDHEYVIADTLKVAYVDPSRGLAWCKDLGDKSIVKTSIHEGEQIDFMNNAKITGETGQNGRDWDQSNWILLQFTAPTGSNGIDEMLKNAERKLVKPGTIKGKLVDNKNYILKMDLDRLDLLTQADEGYDETPYEANVYCPSNFLPENLNIWGSIEAGDGAYSGNNTQNYFFMNPKIQEVCYITYAQWNALGYFTVPSNSGIKGGFQVGWAYNNYNGTPSLQNGKIYKFHAIVNRNDKEYGPNNPISAKDELPFSEHITVLPIDLTGDDNIITAINTVSANGEVKSVKYVNVAGIVSDTPFQGVNIVVTEYTDGSRTTSKMLRK